MKKAKVLIPAIAVLALSAASAVTGTVAWFTATRSTSFAANNIVVLNTEGGVDVALSNPVGGVATATGKTATYLPLTDASVDMSTATPTVWKNILKDGEPGLTYKSIPGNDDGTLAYTDATDSAGNKVYRAAKYTATFTLGENTAQSAEFGLFFDKDTSTATGTDNTIRQALRIGFKCADATWSVWAPFKTISTADKYVFAASETTTKTYGTGEIVTAARPGTAETNTNKNQGYLDDLTGQDNSTTVDIWTWFDGEDAKLVNTESLSNMKWSLGLSFAIVEKGA